jgi:hypothetical protein
VIIQSLGKTSVYMNMMPSHSPLGAPLLLTSLDEFARILIRTEGGKLVPVLAGLPVATTWRGLRLAIPIYYRSLLQIKDITCNLVVGTCWYAGTMLEDFQHRWKYSTGRYNAFAPADDDNISTSEKKTDFYLSLLTFFTFRTQVC